MSTQPQSLRQLVRHRRRGYVLLVVLVAIVISTVVLAQIANLSSSLAIDAISQQDALQKRWAQRTVSDILLRDAREVFDRREEVAQQRKLPQPPPVLMESIQLGNIAVSVVLADEDAKANLNTLYHAGDVAAVESFLQRSLDPITARRIALRPAVVSRQRQEQRTARSDSQDEEDDDEDQPPMRAFRSWGEVFPWRQLNRNYPAVFRNMTLWGTGRLNVRRAEEQVFISTCRPVVQDGLAKRLADRYRKHPELGIRLTVEKEVVNPRDRLLLQESLGESSSCFSVWISLESRHGQQQVFSVIQPDNEGTLRTVAFSM